MLAQDEGPIEVAQEVDALDLAEAHIEVVSEHAVGEPLLDLDAMILLDQFEHLLGGPDVSPAVLEALDGRDDGGLLL